MKDFELLHEMRDFLQWRCRDAILLAEANVPPEESNDYFGDHGERLQMMLNFPVNQRLFYALATGDIESLCWALRTTANRPRDAQWVNFLRSHDECDLGRLSSEQRQKVFEAFGPDEDMRLFGRGIRRRLTPMLGNDRRRLELAFSLLLALPCTPMLQYGDEIGMGDDLSLTGRECARTPMQWSDEPQGGFSLAEETVRPVIDDDVYGYQRVNVADQRRDADSLLNWLGRMIKMRRECLDISWGQFEILSTSNPPALVLRYDWRNTSTLVLHNFSHQQQSVRFDVGVNRGGFLADLITPNTSRADHNGMHTIELDGYGYRWFRVGAVDNTLNRSTR